MEVFDVWQSCHIATWRCCSSFVIQISFFCSCFLDKFTAQSRTTFQLLDRYGKYIILSNFPALNTDRVYQAGLNSTDYFKWELVGWPMSNRRANDIKTCASKNDCCHGGARKTNIRIYKSFHWRLFPKKYNYILYSHISNNQGIVSKFSGLVSFV